MEYLKGVGSCYIYIYFLDKEWGVGVFESVVGVDQENKKVGARKILKGAVILIIKIKKHLDWESGSSWKSEIESKKELTAKKSWSKSSARS